MECPKCRKEINHVNVISTCWQKGELKGNKIVDYGSVEDVMDTALIECPECQEDITEFVKE